MKNPLFSIIIPMYQAEKFIVHMIRSIQKQSFNSYEVLMVDDGSTDGTRERCTEIAVTDDRFKLVAAPHAGCAGAPRNLGIRTAQGDYILFADADDEFEPDTFEQITKRLEKTEYPDMLLAGCNMGFHDSEGHFQFSGEKKWPMEIDRPISGKKMLEQFGQNNLSSPCNSFLGIFKRNFLLENNLFQSEKLILGEDYEWMPRVLFAASSIASSSVIHYRYIRHQNSITTNLSERSLTDTGRAANLLRDFFLVHKNEMSAPIRKFWCKYTLESFLWFFFNPMYHDRIEPATWYRAWKNSGMFASFADWRKNAVLFRKNSRYKQGFIPFLILAAFGWRKPGELYFKLGSQ